MLFFVAALIHSASAADCTVLFSRSVLCQEAVAKTLQQTTSEISKIEFLNTFFDHNDTHLSSADLNVLVQTVRGIQVPEKYRRVSTYAQFTTELEFKKTELLAKISVHYLFRGEQLEEVTTKAEIERMLDLDGPTGAEAAQAIANYVHERKLFSATEAGFILEAIQRLKDPAAQARPKGHYSNLFQRSMSAIRAKLDWFL
jgi:hypothetical protein